MLSVENKVGEYILDLNNTTENRSTLRVFSSDNGRPVRWSVYRVSDPNVTVGADGPNRLYVEVDLMTLKNDFFIILRNMKNEYVRVVVKHNIEMSREKKYIFKVGKVFVNDGGVIVVNVLSKENGKFEPWHVSYKGEPLEYEFKERKSKVSILPKTTTNSDFVNAIVLTQDNSGKELRVLLKHKSDGTVEIEKAG